MRLKVNHCTKQPVDTEKPQLYVPCLIIEESVSFLSLFLSKIPYAFLHFPVRAMYPAYLTVLNGNMTV